MSERYTRLFTLPEENLYAIGSPIIICAGALLKDTLSGNIIAQLKFRNIGNKTVSALKVSIRTFDIFGKELEGITEYQYLDLAVLRNQEFGQKTAVVLPNPDTRSFCCDCRSVVFADGSVWEAKEANWSPLKKQESLQSRFGDLISQYQRDIGDPEARFVAINDRDLWFCTCGAINNSEEKICHSCKAKIEKLKEAEDTTLLKEHLQEYLQKEEQARLEAERKAEIVRVEKARKAEEERIVAEQQKKKNIKRVITAFAIIALIAVIIIVYTTIIHPIIDYNNAKELYEKGQYEEAIAAFETMNGYRDSAEQIEKCEDAIKDVRYSEAIDLYNAGNYGDAIVVFSSLIDYKDSRAYVEACELTMKNQEYENAVLLLESEQYEDAIIAFQALKDFNDSKDRIIDCKYHIAIKLYENGEYEEAIAAFTALNGYKDSSSKIKEITPLYKKALLASAKIGSIVLFGKYEQDNNMSNGKENIEWQVLAKEGDKILLLSNYALDSQPYHTTNTNVTWKTSSLRKWLNETFFNNAFDTDEMKMILTTSNCTTTDTRSNKSTDEITNDRVFLLSVEEAKKYSSIITYDNTYSFKKKGTDYCFAQGAKRDGRGSTICRYWWLRDIGCSSAGIYGGSYIDVYKIATYEIRVEYSDVAVCPAIWIDVG